MIPTPKVLVWSQFVCTRNMLAHLPVSPRARLLSLPCEVSVPAQEHFPHFGGAQIEASGKNVLDAGGGGAARKVCFLI